MNRISGITPNTYKEMFYDVGVVFDGLDYSAAKTVAELKALVEPAIKTEACFGATRGGLSFSSSSEFEEITLDDKFYSVIGDMMKGKTTVTLKFTVVQFSPENFRRGINAARVTEDGDGRTIIREATSIDTASDYIDLSFVIRQGNGDFAVFELFNAINTEGTEIKTNDKGQAEMSLTYVASNADPDDPYVPYKITIIPKGA